MRIGSFALRKETESSSDYDVELVLAHVCVLYLCSHGCLHRIGRSPVRLSSALRGSHANWADVSRRALCLRLRSEAPVHAGSAGRWLELGRSLQPLAEQHAGLHLSLASSEVCVGPCSLVPHEHQPLAGVERVVASLSRLDTVSVLRCASTGCYGSSRRKHCSATPPSRCVRPQVPSPGCSRPPVAVAVSPDVRPA